jgi:hypothetical protein
MDSGGEALWQVRRLAAAGRALVAAATRPPLSAQGAAKGCYRSAAPHRPFAAAALAGLGRSWSPAKQSRKPVEARRNRPAHMMLNAGNRAF